MHKVLKVGGVLALLALLAAGAFAAFGKKYLEHRADLKTIDGPSVAAVTTDDLTSDYLVNEVAANKRYRDKAIFLRGTIESIGVGPEDQPYIALATKFQGIEVYAFFYESRGVDLVGPKDKTNLKCIVDGFVGGVPKMRMCRMVDYTPHS